MARIDKEFIAPKKWQFHARLNQELLDRLHIYRTQLPLRNRTSPSSQVFQKPRLSRLADFTERTTGWEMYQSR